MSVYEVWATHATRMVKPALTFFLTVCTKRSMAVSVACFVKEDVTYLSP